MGVTLAPPGEYDSLICVVKCFFVLALLAACQYGFDCWSCSKANIKGALVRSLIDEEQYWAFLLIVSAHQLYLGIQGQTGQVTCRKMAVNLIHNKRDTIVLKGALAKHPARPWVALAKWPVKQKHIVYACTCLLHRLIYSGNCKALVKCLSAWLSICPTFWHSFSTYLASLSCPHMKWKKCLFQHLFYFFFHEFGPLKQIKLK